MFQRSVDSFTLPELRRLSRARVAICGVGGGGCIVAEILARSGVGFLRLIDGDRFEESNLNRQLGCTGENLGLFKAEVMARRLRSISPYVRVEHKNEFLTSETADVLLSDVDIVCDTVDGAANKLMLGEQCKRLGKVEATGGIGDVRCWTALLVNRYVSEILKLHNGRSIYANPGTCFLQGAFQAQEILNWLCGRDWNATDKKIEFNHNTYALYVEDIGEDV